MVYIDKDSEDYEDYPKFVIDSARKIVGKALSKRELFDKGILAQAKVKFYEIQETPVTIADHAVFASPKDVQMADMNTQFKDLEKQVTDSAVLNDSVAKLNSDMDVLMALVDGVDQPPVKRVYKR